MNSYIYTGDMLTGVVDNADGSSTHYTVDKTHVNFESILLAVKEGRFSDIPDLVSVAKAVNQFGKGSVVVDEDEGVIRYNGEVVHNSLTQRVMQMVGEGFTVEPFINFLNNLMQNPSKRAVDELYKFLEYGKLPITEDGCFLAYKRVRDDFYDCHSGTVLNKMASQLTEAEHAKLPYTTNNGVTVELVDGVVTVSMVRNKVDDRSEHTCSYGLHFCSLDYLSSFWGDHVMVLKINPADVVSIPVDYNNTKGRCAMYQVVGEYKGNLKEHAFDKSVVELGETEDTDELEWEDYDVDYPEVLNETDFVEGYLAGYTEGRQGMYQQYTNFNAKDDYDYGYADGYKDGKNHRKRKYT